MRIRTLTLMMTLGTVLLATPTALADGAVDGYGCEVETSIADAHCFDGGSHVYCLVQWHYAPINVEDICFY